MPTAKQQSARNRVVESLLGLIAAAVRQQTRELSLTALSTLSTLEQGGPRRITELAALEQVSQPSMTSLVSSLERSGLVARERVAEDQRVVLATLTAEGTVYLRERRRSAAATLRGLLDELSNEEVDLLVAAAPVFDRLRMLEIDARAVRPTGGTGDLQ